MKLIGFLVLMAVLMAPSASFANDWGRDHGHFGRSRFIAISNHHHFSDPRIVIITSGPRHFVHPGDFHHKVFSVPHQRFAACHHQFAHSGSQVFFFRR